MPCEKTMPRFVIQEHFARTHHFDFVLANPPFNFNAADQERLKDMVGYGPHGNARHFPFGPQIQDLRRTRDLPLPRLLSEQVELANAEEEAAAGK